MKTSIGDVVALALIMVVEFVTLSPVALTLYLSMDTEAIGTFVVWALMMLVGILIALFHIWSIATSVSGSRRKRTLAERVEKGARSASSVPMILVAFGYIASIVAYVYIVYPNLDFTVWSMYSWLMGTAVSATVLLAVFVIIRLGFCNLRHLFYVSGESLRLRGN